MLLSGSIVVTILIQKLQYPLFNGIFISQHRSLRAHQLALLCLKKWLNWKMLPRNTDNLFLCLVLIVPLQAVQAIRSPSEQVLRPLQNGFR